MPTSSSSTPATSARRRPKRSIPSSAACGGSRSDAARGPPRLVAVAGCVAQAEGEEILRRAPAVDLVVGPQSYHRLPDAPRARRDRRRSVDTEFPVEDKFDLLKGPSREATRARGVTAFVTVQEGCDKFCTFCVVPYTRGAEVSRPVTKIVAEVERLADAGVREVTLIGQNVNAYHGEGPDGAVDARPTAPSRRRNAGHRAPALHHQPSARHGRQPDRRASRLAGLMPQLHLPVQSGSDRILAAMNRRHTRAEYLPSSLACARRGLTSRSRPISSSVFRARARRISATRSDWSRRSVSRARSRSNIRRARARRPPTWSRVPEPVKAERLQRLQAAIDRQQARVQCAMRRPQLRRAVREAGPASGPDGGALALSAARAGHGAGGLDGRDRGVTVTALGANSLFGTLRAAAPGHMR